MVDSICQNLEETRQRIHNACKSNGRDPERVTLVAVSKTKPASDITTAIGCAQHHFGENRPRELQEKMEELDSDSIVWHYVGPIQTNKIKYMVGRVDWIHSVYKKKYLSEIEKRASSADRIINVLIQVNISREGQKQGCEPGDLEGLLTHATTMKHLRVRGLMGMATYTDNPEEVRGEFRMLRELSESHQHLNSGSVKLEELSMGMTNDLEVAIEEGATMVRIGTAIFGARNYNT